ncbi:riboflavin synthase [Salegentibacter sediminis]|uniref:riboflavin synthase n=1 Tax=Salegentibacter sediminis TaxID=1930251 RepID=UPI0009C16578|nr:riboflavin synthase [Salegentibacter sediminis]
MFTGIIEETGKVTALNRENGNLHIKVKAQMTSELKVDQSVAHNGVCLTVVNIEGDEYTVTAIQETQEKSNLGDLKVGAPVNLERGMKLGARLDGHIVQGHVDQTAVCKQVLEKEGSWEFTFEYDPTLQNVTIEKGSITVNGVSLTVVNSKMNEFSVAIIPYTFEQTTFKNLKEGDRVNLEFDVIGKYVKRLNELRQA